MPKIFLTGSGNSRGYVTGSGILNNPVRTIIRDRDNRAGMYPTLHRMNRKDTSGMLTNIVFDDTKTIKFGNSIKDDFTIEEINIYSRPVDSTLWKTSTPDVLIKKEFDPRADFELTTGAVVLGGVGDADGRWLQSAKKVRNPTLTFSLLQGPYNNQGALARFKLNLDKGALTDVFKVQISEDESTWVDVSLKNIHLGTNDVWADSLIVNEINKHVVPRDIMELRRVFTALGAPEVGNQFKPILNFKLDMQDFAAVGISNDFYIRFIQPSISDTNINVWAIGRVSIISRNETATYPYLGTGDAASLYHLSQSIATPNFINSLTGLGSSIKGVTDSGVLPFNPQENTPFNEESVISIDNSGFFSAGVKEDVTPGFSSPLLNKTVFEYNMTPAEEDILSLGLLKRVPNGNIDGNQLMAYWNSNLNKWEPMGQPLVGGQSTYHPSITPSNITEASAQIYSDITSSCAGFGPLINPIVEYNGTTYKLLNQKAQANSHAMTNVFGFPNAAKYHATSSQYIQAKDIGITKPFLLEKLVLDFELDWTFPNAYLDGGGESFALNYVDNTIGRLSPVHQLHCATPTFFILRQFETVVTAEASEYFASVPGTLGFPNNGRIVEPIPKRVKLVSGSNDETYVEDSRELITFGQHTIIVTGSQPRSGFPLNPFINDMTMQDILASGIVKDGVTVEEVSTTDQTNTFIVSDQLKFPARITSKHERAVSVQIKNQNPSGAYNKISFIRMENTNLSRTISFDGMSRAIVNGSPGLRYSPGGEVLIDSSSRPSVTRTPAFEQIVFDSPYLIQPEDKLIFGWHFPMPSNISEPTSAVGDPLSMKIQKSNLKMFGSQIKAGKEFHEGLNQNLTSDAIHEVIGNEPVVDQFQISTVGELSGSCADDYFLGLIYRDPGDTSGAGNPINILGRNIPTQETRNLAQGFTSDDPAQRQRRYEMSVDPVKRVGATYSQTAAAGIFSAVANNLPPSNNESRVGMFNQPGGKYVQPVQRFNNLTDTARIYRDARILNLSLSERPFTYGSYQNYTFYYPSGYANQDRRFRGGGSPKYYFNLNHYGYASDFIRQGLDSRFDSNADTIRNRPIVEAAVRARFVEDDYDEENLNFRKFSLVKPSDIDGTAYETFQSSNISLFATSSLPFKEGSFGSTSLDVPTNRTYSVVAVEVS